MIFVIQFLKSNIHYVQTQFSPPSQEKKLRTLTCFGSTNLRFFLIIEQTRCTISQLYFGKELYMFRTEILPIIRSLDTVFTATGICYASYVDCLLVRSEWNFYYKNISRCTVL
jgi:hypothetical protein